MCGFNAELQFNVPTGTDDTAGLESVSTEEQSANFALSLSEDLFTIGLQGEIDIAVSVELKAALLKALASGCDVCISLAGATALDLTAFQLLWSARREVMRAGLNFSITGELSESILLSLRQLGLDEFLSRAG